MNDKGKGYSTMAGAMETYREAAGIILQELPRLWEALRPGKPLEEIPGWPALSSKPRALVETGGKPVLVAALLGPTGAGKSTLFTLLTGVEVPRALRRPTSHAIALAIPPRLNDESLLGRLFPGFRLLRLSDPAVLTRENQPVRDLHYATAETDSDPGDTLSLALADVPDFNSIDAGNWQKAAAMTARAEVVVFVTYPESYKDEVVVRHLLPVCRQAGHLVFIFNKVPPEEGGRDSLAVAAELRADLLAHMQSPGSGFHEIRAADGLPLHEFFARSPCHAAPHDPNLSLDKVQPLRPDRPDLASALRGLDAARVLLNNLIEISAESVLSCQGLLEEARVEAALLEKRVEEASAALRKEAAAAAGGQFPIGRLLLGLAEEAREKRPGWMRPLAWPGRVLGQTFQTVQQIARFLTNQSEGLAPRKKLEEERLRVAAQQLTDAWRSSFPEEKEGCLRADLCHQARRELARHPLPPVGRDWEDSVRAAGAEWAAHNRFRATALATLADLFMVGGLASIALDLVALGGAGTVGVVAAAGLGAGAAAFFLEMFNRLGLRKVLEEADRQWRQQRTGEMASHLETLFAIPLFLGKWKERLRMLRGAPREPLETACRLMLELRGKKNGNE